MANRWEYLFVSLPLHKDRFFGRWINGTEVPDWKNGTGIPRFASKAGEEGWELVSMFGPGAVTEYMSKRPKT